MKEQWQQIGNAELEEQRKIRRHYTYTNDVYSTSGFCYNSAAQKYEFDTFLEELTMRRAVEKRERRKGREK